MAYVFSFIVSKNLLKLSRYSCWWVVLTLSVLYLQAIIAYLCNKQNNVKISQNQQTDTTTWTSVLSQSLAVLAKNNIIFMAVTLHSFPTLLIPAVSENYPDTIQLTESELSWIGSIAFICFPVGCIFSGIATEAIGRKRVMQFISIPFVICWLIMYHSTEIWQIFFPLAMLGLFSGLVEAAVFAYVSEITEPSLRGIFSATTSIASALGVLCQFLLGSLFHWRTITLINCLVPTCSFFGLMFIPESPYWLIDRKRLDEAQKNLAWLRGWTTSEKVEIEFQMIIRNLEDQRKENDLANSLPLTKKLRLLTRKNFIWPFLLTSFIFAVCNFSGGTTLRVYAVKLFSVLEAPIDRYHATVFLGLAELLGALTTLMLIRNLGKRILAFISLFGVAISNIVIATYAYVLNISDIIYATDTTKEIEDLEHYKWIPFVFLFLLAYMSQLGLRILPWVLISEVYLNDIRSTACGISGGVAFLLAFAANKIYLNMISLYTIPGTYWIYAGITVIGIVVIYFALPETEGKTLKEITDHFSGIAKLDKTFSVKCSNKTKRPNENLGFQSEE